MAVAVLGLLLACGADGTEAAEPVDREVAVAEQAIINGDLASYQEIVALRYRGGWSCTALLVRNDFAVTAKHCLLKSDGTERDASYLDVLTSWGETASVIYTRLHPTLDVGVVRLGTGLTMLGRTRGAFQEFYPMYATSMVGQWHYCVGWGWNTCTSGADRARWAFLPLTAVNTSGTELTYSEGSYGQTFYHGDSGGSCWVNFNGRYVWTGIVSGGPDCGNADPMYTVLTAGQAIRGWVLDQVDVFSRTDAFTSAQTIRACYDATGMYEVCNASALAGGPANWRINTSTKQLEESSNAYVEDSGGIKRDGTQLIFSQNAMGDGSIQVRAWSSSGDNDAAGLILRMRDSTHYYRFSVDAQRGYARIVRRSGSSWTNIAEVAFDIDWISPGHTIKFAASGYYLGGYVDGVLVVLGYDPDYYYMDGRAGIYDYGLKDARFDDLVIQPF